MQSEESVGSEATMSIRQISMNGSSIDTSDIEGKLDEGNIEEAESALCEALSLNSQEARAILGRLEYQRGNMEAVLRVFDGIDFQGAIDNFQPPASEKLQSRRSKSVGEPLQLVPQQAPILVLEAMYLKSKSLQKLGRLKEAAEECRSVLDAIEKVFCNGIPDSTVDNKLQETVSGAVQLLPELCKETATDEETVAAYRHALLSQWNLDNECCARIQKAFATFLLYSGVEASAHSLAAQVDGSFVPKNNFEEAILILMILLRKSSMRKIKWDPTIMEHFKFAVSLCGQTAVVAKKMEEVLPGTYPRCERWKCLALCYSGAGQSKVALNLLRKSLNKYEKPNDPIALLLASKICSEDCHLASEGVAYARRAIENAQGANEYLKGVGLQMLGVCLGKQAKVASSDMERSLLQSKAMKSLNEATACKHHTPELIFELGVTYLEHRNANAALHCAKEFIDKTGGSILKGWKLLALALSAQQRHSEAEVVIDTALDETTKWDQGPLLRMKAKLKIAQSLPMEAVETYRFLLALVQAQKDAFVSFRKIPQAEDDNVSEFEVWQGLAIVYSSLSHWDDAELCLEKARELRQYDSSTWHAEGVVHEAQGQTQEGFASYSDALLLDLYHAPSKVSVGATMRKTGSKSLPVARSFLSDALKLEPTNHMAWYYLGMVHRDNGRMTDASDCFLAAAMLEESEPVESFSSAM
ncbi:tetratricopeptide repeat protein 7A-like protein [Cinnamomum micranthum f. kanehirae]|uniref:Tetratricopeptide repeat protein 7A-like protein n=1 Tax=Cinnamomum micranthum f. kanehirae TaxID=337451 RepID=A0A3S3QC62_9MAGN|nr:tetratricopeptide repeat protein 7A-like protein [Cinnamomum micranthum f. kanehirae]